MVGSTNLDVALGLAESGFNVFPLIAGRKEPVLEEDWKVLATRDPVKIRAMWPEGKADRNVGIRTGVPLLDGYLVVIDIDVKDGKPGRRAIAELEARHGPMEPTLTFRTASGGEHRYFIVPFLVGSSNSKLGPGIDVRGVGGYVVGPGSTVGGKPYTLSNSHSIGVLSEVYAVLCGRPRERSALSRDEPLVEWDTDENIRAAAHWLATTAPQHGTYTVACRVRGWGISRDKCLELMMDHWPPAEAKGTEHVETRVNNAYTYAQDPPGIACAEVEFEPVEGVELRDDAREPADLWEHDSEPGDDLSGVVPDYVSRFAEDRAHRLGVSAGAMTAATVTALSSLVPAGNNLHLRQNSDSWSVKCIIWTAIIGDPGTAKSPAVNAAMAFPEALEKSWRTEFAKALGEFERTQLATSRSKKRPKDLPKEPEPLTPDVVLFPDDGSADATPTAAPKLRRKIVNDATTEAIGLVLHDGPAEAPVLVHSDELVGLIGGMDAYRVRGSKDKPFFLQAKEGKPYAIDRKSSGTLIVPSLAMSILGTIQDEKLSKIAPTLTDDGFLQRFALVIIRKTGRGADIPDNRSLDGSIARIAHALADLEPTDYRLSPEAACELDAINDFSEREGRRPDIASGLRTWLSKTPNEFGRYCLAFHLIEWASSLEPALGTPPAGLVSVTTANRARRYVEEFLYSHAQYVYGTVMAMGQDDGDVKWVAGYILCRELKTINAREIGRAYRSLRGAQKRPKLFSVMATLAQNDWVKLTNPVRGEWRVNKAVHSGRFEEIKRAETTRRLAVRAEITLEAERRRSAKEMRP
ncbi:DUF3987 domain-containing protein [Tardiphaga sp. P9-11]|uniref:DUF3987 domain-containing protein n=1 Tax=Tardiphaga sp. P9-11 TaxID=2024614 RepID=UPI0011F12D37|nr:DUF3987 domain-containing protein [Tardiphaga sp. P9-11]KAA0076133.1 DUF3987 domain-containing protein [Tardiphaga sp. P9-11]